MKTILEYPFNKKLELLEKPTFGAQQLIENRIEELLIQLIRERINAATDIRFVMNSAEFENELINDIILILKENLYSRITLDTISSKTFYSKTYINTIFKKNSQENNVENDIVKDELSMIEYKESIFRKIINKIKSIFRRQI